MNKDDFIKNLSSELKPVKVNWKPSLRAILWASANLIFVLTALSFHESFSMDLSGRWIEFAVLILVVGILAYFSFLGVIPGAIERYKLKRGLLSLLAFIAYYLFIELLHLTPKVNMVMRSSCDLEIIIMSNLPAISLFYFLYKDRENLNSWSPFIGGCASALIPALVMNFTCSYSLIHVMAFHFIPIFIFALFFHILFSGLKRWQ